MTDTELLNWLEKQQGYNLVSSDNGYWAVSTAGTQAIPTDPPGNMDIVAFVDVTEWKPTIREAIEAAIQEEEETEQ